ncbi:MAG: zinc ABC transporter substrate-binding protein [Lachnospiraceae bacterium]|nr:zinc ABC transporter substrate-binding protein [Lachnospiraceae bacterium]
MAVILAAGIAAAAVTGCGVKQEEPDDGKLKIVTTIFPQYDFVRAIAGGTGAVNVRMLLSPGEEVHSYEPTPLDIKEIQNCDLFIYVGAENDVWVDRILENMGDKRPETLRLVDLTETVAEESVEGMMEEKGHDHEESREEEADEHVWTSPVKAAEITEAIAQKIAELDPANADDYLANAQDYEAKILDLDAQFRQIAENAERKVLVFGDRFPIRYFAEGYGLDYFAAFPGCSSESEPSASTLAFLIDKVREEEIPVVFSIEFSNGNIARAICESTGAVQRTYNSCHNVTKEQMENGATYVSLMSENLEAVREALGKGAKK